MDSDGFVFAGRVFAAAVGLAVVELVLAASGVARPAAARLGVLSWVAAAALASTLVSDGRTVA
ncbi:MAG: hypothetical protein ACTH9H_06740 [Galactobacter sp.]